MTLGKRFGSAELNIIDTAAMPGLRGSYKYDDEGVPATKTYLIREGKLVGRLHSRETAAKMKEKPTGNARAVSYHYPPIVRMTNTYIEPGSVSFDNMISDIKEGIYVKNWYGGTTSMEMFTFSAGEAYMIHIVMKTSSAVSATSWLLLKARQPLIACARFLAEVWLRLETAATR